MQRNTLILLPLLAMALAAACQFQTKKQGSEQTTPQSSGPDNNELLETLAGDWRSLEDSTYTIEIRGNKMRHLNRGTLSVETTIEVDVNCDHLPCNQPAGSAEGWCFVEKDSAMTQCNMVLHCDSLRLDYTALGSTGKTLSFVRQ